MKKTILLLTILFTYFLAIGQGVDFRQFDTWENVCQKAQANKKLIFVDCFASWCIPCKEMETKVFSTSKAGFFFNQNFLNIKIQFDSTKNDTEFKKSWRIVGKQFEMDYKVYGFPTYLIFNSDGKIIGKLDADFNVTSFIANVERLLEPQNQYSNLKEKFLAGDRSKTVIKTLLPKAVEFEDWKIAYALHNDFVDILSPPFSREDLVALYASISSTEDKGFRFLKENHFEVDSILKEPGRAESILRAQVEREIYSRFIKGKKSIDWAQLESYAKEKLPTLSDKILMGYKVWWANENRNYEEYGRLRLEYYDRFADKFSHNELFMMNNELMDIFKKCFNKETLLRASKWSKVTIYREPGKESPSAMDTYANLLYKAGNVQEALKWQERAISLADNEARINQLKRNLALMHNHQPTWPTTTH